MYVCKRSSLGSSTLKNVGVVMQPVKAPLEPDTSHRGVLRDASVLAPARALRNIADDEPRTWVPATTHMRDQEFQAPGFNLTHPDFCRYVGSELADGRFRFTSFSKFQI